MQQNKSISMVIVVKLICLFTLQMMVVNNAYAQAALPKDITYTRINNLPVVGQTTMKWLWLAIYDAKLLTPSGAYQAKARPLGLALTYKRNISSADLVESTQEQWQRLQFDYQPQWLQTLGTMWPDVKKGDEIMLVVDKHQHAWFFYNGDFIGGIEADSALSMPFSEAFSQIWLSENALVPKLRNQLVGQPNA